MTETTIDYQTGEILPARTAESQEWYQALVEDCRAIVIEAEFNSRWALVEGYWTLGKRIRQESNLKEAAKGNYSSLQGLARNIGLSPRTLYYALQAYDKYPDLTRIPDGKAISWNRLITKYLPEPSAKDDVSWSEPAHSENGQRQTVTCPSCGVMFEV